MKRLQSIEERYNEINEEMMSPEIVSDPKRLAKLGKEQASLKQSVEAYEELKGLNSHIEQAEEMAKEHDPELKEMAQMELEELLPKKEALIATQRGSSRFPIWRMNRNTSLLPLLRWILS